MTLLKIEVKTVTGKYHPEDMIKIWAPALRSNGDVVVSTAPEIVKLVQGKAQVELLPGPARVQIMCGGTLDNAVRKVTIPDAATATLRAVLEEGFDWEPEIVTEVMRYRNEAVAASTSAAEEAADAAASASAAATSATNAATSAQSASSSKTAASTSAKNAATSATNAATSATSAATHEDNSLDAAAAAIAAAVSVAQFQGHGFPNGQVAAPVGSIYTDLDATAGAIRWIKASGTGNTGWQVAYGDTGWRNVSALLGSGVSGNAFVSRVGETVNFMFHNVSTSSAGHITLFSLPAGFLPANISGANWRNGSVLSDNGDTVRPVSYFGGNFRVLNMPTGKAFGGSVSLVAEDGWPATLPGTPA